jgi:hypothetical protein
VRFAATADKRWAQTAPGSVICPTPSAVNKDWTKHAPVADLALDRYASRPAVSVWSWQRLTPTEWFFLGLRVPRGIAT